MTLLGSTLAMLLVSAWVPQDGTPSPDAWSITTLWHRAHDWHEAAVELQCIGNPPYFRVRLVSLQDSVPLPLGDSGDDYLGSFRAGGGEPRAIQWTRAGDTDLTARLLNSDVAAYRASGEIELVVELIEGRTFRLYSPTSSDIEDHIDQFLSGYPRGLDGSPLNADNPHRLSRALESADEARDDCRS